jgi:hypothetical protein
MKKFILLMVTPLVFVVTLSAQVSQEEADEIVQQRLEGETQPCSVYAKEGVQTEFEVLTATGETLELNYPAWVYYVSYADETNGKYLIVKESNGNLLEINTKNDTEPSDLAEWRVIRFEIPFTEYSLEGTSCQWVNLNYDEEVIIINSAEELENYISCTEGTYPDIDFSQHTLLLASGTACRGIDKIHKNLLQLSCNEYELNIELILNNTDVLKKWTVAFVVRKLTEESHIEMNVGAYPIEIPIKEYSLVGLECEGVFWHENVIIINSVEELEYYHVDFCWYGTNYPSDVDFSTHTLLLVQRFMCMQGYTDIINITFNQNCTNTNEYELNVIIYHGPLAPISWLISVITPKIASDANILLNDTYTW